MGNARAGLGVIAAIAILIWLESRGPVLARPHRVGRNGRMVKVFEFHTAKSDPDAMEMVGGCHGEQVTRIGGVLRRLGIAQWPLLINVLRGDLSLVGPRAELPRYVGCYPTADRKLILSVKPGLADLATIEFTDEKRMLAGLQGDELEQAYVEQVLPIRLDYAKRYLEQRGFWLDARILLLGLTRGFLR
jgi:lipopolysaccharide/colanic/teichoic acid biosynthesis glycosyltransferase